MKSSAGPKSVRGADTSTTLEAVTPMTDDNDKHKRGIVLRMERSSIHDGDGFRTVIFLKGCPLRCLWCSTPESLSPAIEHAEGKTYGSAMSVEQLIAEVRKDSIFYFHSGGGLTLSGGEPLVQSDFAAELLKQAQQECINTAIETSLSVPFAKVEKVLPHLDTLYADFKHIEPEMHKRYCGMDNAVILDNFQRIDERAKGLKFIIRIPLIPGINDDQDTLEAMGAFCAGLRNLHSVQLLPYHRLGVDTYRKLGRTYPLQSLQAPAEEHMEVCRGILRSHVGGGVC